MPEPGHIPPLLPMAIAQTVFTLILLLTKERRRLHDLIGCVWVLAVALAAARRSLQIAYGPDPDNLFIRMATFPLSYGPLLYLYTRVLIHGETRLKKRDLLHALPFVVATAVFLHPSVHAEPFRIDLPLPREGFFVFLAFGAAASFSLFFYCTISMRMLKKHKQSLPNAYSYESMGNSLRWLNLVCWLFLVQFATQSLVLAVLPNLHLYPSYRIVGGQVFGFLVLLSFFLVRQPAVIPSDASPAEAPAEKYARSRADADTLALAARNLSLLMEEERVYLNEDLTIDDLADKLSLNRHVLSQSLNLHLQKNFFTFVNDYRVKEAMSRLRDPAYREHPVLRIAYDCGFKSKSTFNAVFKKAAGMSPAEFRDVKSEQ